MENYTAALADFRCILETEDPRHRSTSESTLAGVCCWHLNRPDEALNFWQSGLTAPYVDAAGGVEVPAILLYAAERLNNQPLRKDSIKRLQNYWKKHLRRQDRLKTALRPTHDDLVHPSLPAWPGAIVPFLLGETDEQQLLQAAQSSTVAILRTRRTCHAQFYRGLRGLCEADRLRFRDGMQKCGSSTYGMLEHEYFLARWELDRGFPEPAFAGDKNKERSSDG